MPTVIYETETEKWYLYNVYTQYGKRYVQVRRYKLTDRWRRIKDKWYTLDEPPEELEERWFRADFDIRKDYPE